MHISSGRSPFFYGYIVVAAAFVIQIMTWGLFNSYGIFFNALQDDFGWSHTLISGAASVSQFLVGVGAVFMGRLSDRFGPRLLMTFVGIMVGAGFSLMYLAHSPWQLYLFQGFIMGIGISGTDVVLLSATARWFVRRRGLMSGIVKVGTGVGTMIAPLVITWLIAGYGWRDAYLVVGLALFVFVMSAQVLRRDPAGMHLLPDGDAVRNPEDITAAERGSSLREAARTRPFWMICLMFLSAFFCTFSIVVHFAPSVVNLGQTEAVGATMVSILGGASIAGRLLMGIGNDKIGSRQAMVLVLAVLAAAFVWLQVAEAPWSLVIFAVPYGFCHGGLFTLISPLVAEYFGIRAHGTILGIVVFCGGIGGALGPFVIGRIVDATGSYDIPFLLLLGMACLSLVAMVLAGKRRPASRLTGTGVLSG